MKRTMLSGLAALIAISVFFALKVDAKVETTEPSQKTRPKWEYKISGCYDKTELTKMGDEGWELVAVSNSIDKWELSFSTPAGYGGNNKPKLSESTGAIGELKGYGGCSMHFKRQK